MQRWYSRLAGYRRLASQYPLTIPFPLHSKTHDIKKPHHSSTSHAHNGSTSSFSTSARWARRKTRLSEATLADEDKSNPAYIQESKLPRTKDRQHANAWVSVMNRALPARLRAAGSGDNAMVEDDIVGGDISSRDVALILRRAQRSYNLDILTHLGVEEGRWKAVTWLINRVLDSFWKSQSDRGDTSIHARLPGPWKTQKSSLQQITEDEQGVLLNLPLELAPQSLHSLDQVTMEDSPLYEPLEATLTHEVLGLIWRSLGNMIVADSTRTDKASHAITPEILEIIALLHHNGMMPGSIYSYQPSDDSNALRQPPTLHLLSSQILTSLSDAAWRAHESLVVEEAKSKGGQYLSMRPELPGSMFRVHVAGLGHEVWLELVLWSCLHGKWIEEGASILQLSLIHI